MSTTSMLMGSAAAPHAIEHAGRAYQFTLLTQRVKSVYERWLLGKARQIVLTMFDGEEQARELQALKMAAVGGQYDFHGEISLASLQTPAGLLTLGAALCGSTEDEFLALMAAKGDEVRAVIETVLAESIPGAGKRPDPGNGMAGPG